MVCVNWFARRRLVGFLGLIALSLSSTSFAADSPSTDEGLAYARCQADRATAIASVINDNGKVNNPSTGLNCVHVPLTGGSYNRYELQVSRCNAALTSCDFKPMTTGYHWDGSRQGFVYFYSYLKTGICTVRSDIVNLAPADTSDLTSCITGCQVTWTHNTSDPTQPTWHGVYSGSVCYGGNGTQSVNDNDNDGDGQPNATDPCPVDATNVCSEGDTDGDGILNGVDPCPTDATQSCDQGDLDGDGIWNSLDDCPTDPSPTCSADEEETASVTGGTTCASPPICSGDAVGCATLFQTWTARCTTVQNTTTVNNSNTQLNATMASNVAATNAVGEKVDNLKDAFDQAITNDGSNDGAEEGLAGLTHHVDISPSSLDDSGMGFPRVCPQWDDITFAISTNEITIPLSNFDEHCTIFEWMGLLLLAFSAYYSTKILLHGS